MCELLAIGGEEEAALVVLARSKEVGAEYLARSIGVTSWQREQYTAFAWDDTCMKESQLKHWTNVAWPFRIASIV